jgi:catechol 2,3-dioxygenase-like lactoylglutathione lyase family enzyme
MKLRRFIGGTEVMRGVVHHLDLTVRDPEAAFALYDTVLSALGYQLERKSERGFDWNLESPLGTHSIGIVRASTEGAVRQHDRYSPGLHHVAWAVDSREAVDRIHDVVRGIGATVLGAPADYPQYNNGRGYYAVFFADPDGLKLECVYTPPSGALQ